jgi:hypothetical protein
MKPTDYIELGIHLALDDKGYALVSVTYNHNTTRLPDSSKTLRIIANAILVVLEQNEESLVVQDLLHELGIECTPDPNEQ